MKNREGVVPPDALALDPVFYRTAALPCPYLPGQQEQRILTELSPELVADGLFDLLSAAGFRRSHGVMYMHACSRCNACVPVRIPVERFRPNRTQRRVWKRNHDLIPSIAHARATREQYELFERYQHVRHTDGEMAQMNAMDYMAMVNNSLVDTKMLVLRDSSAKLVGASLIDQTRDGYSAVYSFFDPDQESRSLGVHLILTMIEAARRRRLPYVYLGFWIRNCQKMSYKTAYRPVEMLSQGGWREVQDEIALKT